MSKRKKAQQLAQGRDENSHRKRCEPGMGRRAQSCTPVKSRPGREAQTVLRGDYAVKFFRSESGHIGCSSFINTFTSRQPRIRGQHKGLQRSAISPYQFHALMPMASDLEPPNHLKIIFILFPKLNTANCELAAPADQRDTKKQACRGQR